MPYSAATCMRDSTNGIESIFSTKPRLILKILLRLSMFPSPVAVSIGLTLCISLGCFLALSRVICMVSFQQRFMYGRLCGNRFELQS